MIGKLTGRLEYRATDHVMIDVNGVGYVVYCSERSMAQLPAPGHVVSLFTELLVREDLLQLFGFMSLHEKEWHRLLMSVQGIGAKASMAILGALGADGVSRAVTLGDWSAIKAAKGVGPKTAQRVVIELKDKAPNVMAMGDVFAQADSAAAPAQPRPAGEVAQNGEGVVEPGSDQPPPMNISSTNSSSGTAAPVARDMQADALSALINLGYAHGDAAVAIAQAISDDAGLRERAVSELIRAALRLLAPKDQ